jgi:hypothetical protein
MAASLTFRVVIASEAKQSSPALVALDCFVATLLAMTGTESDDSTRSIPLSTE